MVANHSVSQLLSPEPSYLSVSPTKIQTVCYPQPLNAVPGLAGVSHGQTIACASGRGELQGLFMLPAPVAEVTEGRHSFQMLPSRIPECPPFTTTMLLVCLPFLSPA